MLLPLSSPMYDGEFDHGSGGGGCGGPAAAAVAAVVAVEAVEDNISAKAAGNESADGRMMACDEEIGWRTTTQQPTNERRRCGGGSATDKVGGSLAAAAHSAAVQRWQAMDGARARTINGVRATLLSRDLKKRYS